MTSQELEKFARLWRWTMMTRHALFIAAGTCLTAGVCAPWMPVRSLAPAAVATFTIAFLVTVVLTQPWKRDAALLARHLDRKFPELEESSALWLRPSGSLTLLERLQRQRADRAAQRLASAKPGASFAAPPRDLLRVPLLWCAIAVLVLATAFPWDVRPRLDLKRESTIEMARPKVADANSDARHPAAPVSLQMTSAEMMISPPGYTGVSERRISGLDGEVEEGAVVTWILMPDQPVQQANVAFGEAGRDSLRLHAAEDGSLRATRAISEPCLYTISAMSSDGVAWSSPDIHSLKVRKDQPPALSILRPARPRTEIGPRGSAEQAAPIVYVEVLVTDDYGLTAAYLVATVAKGSGEAVKFREQKIAFDADEPADEVAKRRRYSKTLDLINLGLEPGDELYFHVEAIDNREPSSHRARSETRFIVLQRADQSVPAPAGVITGINLVPQYFRSQRQLIIDTEKLITDGPALTVSEFRKRSHELGVDQQLLRQRYGQFLGERVEPEGELFDAEHDHHGAPHNAPEGTEEDDRKSPQTDHAPLPARKALAPYVHQHDSGTNATLFDPKTKEMIREALAAMWKAERFLRMAQPSEGLGPEKHALEILKVLQQSDRAYVQRVGFEPAPLNLPDRRLRGDISSVPERAVSTIAASNPNQSLTEVRELLRMAPWNRPTNAPSPAELDVLRRVEPALTRAATQQPETFSRGLQELRRLSTGAAAAAQLPSHLERALLLMLPPSEQRPMRSAEPSPALAERYFRNLNRAKAE